MIELNNTQEQILIGTILGDAHLNICKSSINPRIEIQHCLPQRVYLRWKYSYLSSLGGSINYKEGKYPFSTVKKIKSLRYVSHSNKLLNKYYNLFYNRGIKNITENNICYLDKLGVAVWYMDDGYFDKRYGRIAISSQSFNYSEHLIIKDYFYRKWGLSLRIIKNKNKFIFHTLKKDTPLFFKLFGDFIDSSMAYKKPDRIILTTKNKQKKNECEGERKWRTTHKKQKNNQHYHQM